jgi:hypothetical protein
MGFTEIILLAASWYEEYVWRLEEDFILGRHEA